MQLDGQMDESRARAQVGRHCPLYPARGSLPHAPLPGQPRPLHLCCPPGRTQGASPGWRRLGSLLPLRSTHSYPVQSPHHSEVHDLPTAHSRWACPRQPAARSRAKGRKGCSGQEPMRLDPYPQAVGTRGGRAGVGLAVSTPSSQGPSPLLPLQHTQAHTHTALTHAHHTHTHTHVSTHAHSYFMHSAHTHMHTYTRTPPHAHTHEHTHTALTQTHILIPYALSAHTHAHT